ncbi:nucleobase:cation symporter-2 family protein [Azospirillum rugosum]|uniref:NCS2 family nucleobase:cation symporter-2 n=1 Tax=Azospirillum rugosum TaxID=416170 RepID=A0ABS4SVC0_9PROT|nr:nucleobase:cation symporter-2 family protein [Azospirillum rugosum]MBP2296507.1 NCS2 family nucleobase:cation symporter-2 [Azospirillum rugosum]MDQ0530093.1 NCS2 family nucleobase:cation symporter-2 [Azospirillum rugosum]
MTTKTHPHPVDEMLPLPRLLALGLQHVMVMYAGAIAVPLIIGGALKLPKDQVALLINADLFACGVVTLIQALGVWKFGIRLPVMMGVTFAAVGPMVAMAGNPELGLLGIYGAVIGAGVFATLAAPLVGRLLPLFPPVVTGSVITIIGISLMRVGVTWAGGGAGNPNFGDPAYLGIALFVLAVILLVTKYAKGFWANISVLLGILAGFALTIALGMASFDGVGQAKWVDAVYPFQFGLPRFEFWSILTMSLVMIVVMIESTGMFLAVGEMVGRPVSREDLTRGLRTDGIGTLIGGIFNTFPYTSFSQNVGLVGITGVRSRWVCVAGGGILLVLGLVPKMAHVVASIPPYVLGGAGLVMFGMVAATGIKILSKVDYAAARGNLYVVAISIGMGMVPLVADKIFQKMPSFLSPLLHSGILLGTIAAVLLNLYFNGLKAPHGAEDFVAAAKTAEV